MSRLLTAGIITLAFILAFIAWLIYGLLYYVLDTPLWMNVLLIFIIAGMLLPIPVVIFLYITDRITKIIKKR